MWQAISYYGALAIQSLVGVVGIRLYEEPRFDIVGSLKNGIEIRRYDPRLAVEVVISQVGDAGRDEAFRLLSRRHAVLFARDVHPRHCPGADRRSGEAGRNSDRNDRGLAVFRFWRGWPAALSRTGRRSAGIAVATRWGAIHSELRRSIHFAFCAQERGRGPRLDPLIASGDRFATPPRTGFRTERAKFRRL